MVQAFSFLGDLKELIFRGIMPVFSYLATFLIRHTGFPAVQVTMILALYGVADIAGNLVLAKRAPNPLEAFQASSFGFGRITGSYHFTR
ncbi:Major facilitator family transporter [Pseudomonas coronafaciens pv. zizaniae]|uniref:hypothetical protein n=1 Tax=Pseudomonas coronafaciens TaxID=53409 RepID=UPI000F3CCA4F|nr:hypothetical protein [Pseudomonas coronafaciens]RMN26840.1 Major facilitator family transporter [Pseudomonas coronafaciens pv. zizaniae]